MGAVSRSGQEKSARVVLGFSGVGRTILAWPRGFREASLEKVALRLGAEMARLPSGRRLGGLPLQGHMLGSRTTNELDPKDYLKKDSLRSVVLAQPGLPRPDDRLGPICYP
jgi:hypothetical protein